jgi:hypothetical protein
LIASILSIPMLTQKGHRSRWLLSSDRFWTDIHRSSGAGARRRRRRRMTLVYRKGNASEKFTGRVPHAIHDEIERAEINPESHLAIEILQARGGEFLPKYLKVVRCWQRQFTECKPFSSARAGAIVRPW